MIIFIEGARAVGKTTLINRFMESCTDQRVEYYKFYFADHVKSLNLSRFDKDPALHYYSLGNIMTILEMNQRPQYKDKIWIFDRAIISAYVWAILRQRLSVTEARDEYANLLSSELFSNCKTIFVKVNGEGRESGRIKDLWDMVHSTSSEQGLMQHLLLDGESHLRNYKRGNDLIEITNDWTEDSIEQFKKACYFLIGQ